MAKSRLNRRDALIHLGAGTAGLLWLPRAAAAGAGPRLGGLTELAELFRRTPRDQVFDRAAAAIRGGADSRTLLGAAFVAGIHDVRPRGVGGKLHCVMMVESAFQLIEAAPAEEAWLAALWSVDDFKNSQQRDRRDGDWVLPPRPTVSFAGEAAARRALVSAMEAWDVAAADRAITGLVAHHQHDSLFEILWPYAARSYTDIGHKIIFCAQVERVLRRLGWRYAEPALRSLVQGLLYLSDSISGTEAEVYARSRELAADLPEGFMRGREEAQESEGLLRELRRCDAPQAQQLVVDAFRAGLGPATVWDGLRLYASELLHRRPKSAARRHGPVHGVTEVNAFAYAFRTTSSETTRRLMILQAAAWLPLLRRDLAGFFGALEGPGVDALGAAAAEGEVPGLVTIFQRPSTDAARVRLDRQPEGRAAFIAELRRHLVRRAFQSHQYKYAAAIREESALVDRRWASRILAPAVTYTPTAADPETEVFDRSRHALRQAGVV